MKECKSRNANASTKAPHAPPRQRTTSYEKPAGFLSTTPRRKRGKKAGRKRLFVDHQGAGATHASSCVLVLIGAADRNGRLSHDSREIARRCQPRCALAAHQCERPRP